MRILIATAGVLSPEPVAALASNLVSDGGDISVITVIEVPRSFLDTIRSEQWHPLTDDSTDWTEEEDAVIERYVAERGHRITEPVLAALRAVGLDPSVRYVEGEDPAETIIAEADGMDADVVVLGATRQLFDDWESVSARVMRDLQRPVLVIPAPGRPDIESEDP